MDANLLQEFFRKRLQSLKGIVKDILFNNGDDAISVKDLRERCSDVTEPEIKVCSEIIECIRPYIPSKNNSCSIIHRLPLVLLANDKHKKIGYQLLLVNISPLSTVSQTNALRIDGPCIYYMMSI
ncbi:hypothetical protein EDC94DRAFT_45777 [Helicostylum pulchrum]|nr:hypothetical protein EDC94DRAFT_45777 [Helicostylum pulchrum]